MPTVLVYERSTGEISSWGFKSETRTEQNAPSKEYVQWFKTCFDQRHYLNLKAKDPGAAPRSHEDVTKWTQDYLRCLYRWVKATLEPQISPPKAWDEVTVDFVFTIPTTWTESVQANFMYTISRAGWCSSAKHSLQLNVTEACATAHYVAHQAGKLFEHGELLQIVDSGGGTTDLNIVEAQVSPNEELHLTHLEVIEGKAVGSVQIDLSFEDLVFDRLTQAGKGDPPSIDLAVAAYETMKSAEFQRVKWAFDGQGEGLQRIPIIGLPSYYNSPRNSIFKGVLHLKVSELRDLFDRQIDGLVSLIKGQIKSRTGLSPDRPIDCLVLSGGTAESLYIQRRIRDHLHAFSDLQLNTLRLEICAESCLAVCKGICFSRLISSHGDSESRVMGPLKDKPRDRIARASYGVACDVLFDSRIRQHNLLHRQTDTLDGKEYLVHGVKWVVLK